MAYILCDNIHGNAANNARLFKLQNKAVHMIHKSKFIAHTYVKMYGILKLEDLLVIQCVQLYDKKSNAHIISSHLSQEISKNTVMLPGRTIIFT